MGKEGLDGVNKGCEGGERGASEVVWRVEVGDRWGEKDWGVGRLSGMRKKGVE